MHVEYQRYPAKSRPADRIMIFGERELWDVFDYFIFWDQELIQFFPITF